MNEYIKNMTPEERAANLEKGRLAKEAKKVAGENLKQNYADLPHWRTLASEYGLRLPSLYLPATETKHIRRALKKLGIEVSEWLEVQGFTKIADFGIANSNDSAVLEVGLALEFKKEKTLDTN